MQYTIQTPLNAEGMNGDLQNVNTPEELYRILNHPGTQWGDLTLSFTPSLKQLQHIVMTQPHLWGLTLSGTAITDISPLSGLLELMELWLNDTPITDVSPLSALKELQILYLNRTAITDVSALSGLLALRELDLRDTAITDLTPLADRYGLRFQTNIGILERGVTPTEIEGFYYKEMLKKAPPTTIPLAKDVTIRPQSVAIRAADYLRQCTSNASLTDPLTDYLRSRWPQYNSSLKSYDPKTRELCLQRADYEVKRSPEIQKHIKGSKEFMSLSGNEGYYAAWIRADMLASIEGRLVMNGQHPSPNLFALAQTEFRFAEEKIQSKPHTKGFSEEAAHMFQLLHLRYLCQYGVEPKPHIIEALKDVSYEVMSRDSYATCAPQGRTCYLLGMVDSLFRGFIFDLRPSSKNLSSPLRYYDGPEKASCMLQTYERKTRLLPTFFERLWLQLSPGFSQEN